ncbi:hypothetical protein J5U18_11835 [Sphingobacteriaceae bacterium WQ 2009]|uniref:Uncharacterized protein n=1 Tax=Rhinopithecimicrobium faecis TaxID=2820698 RepID=A0A8T4HD59_9SPHI|nr:hypothetical protein [Sphingobacteriaceae bacterium WQ 2009]
MEYGIRPFEQLVALLKEDLSQQLNCQISLVELPENGDFILQSPRLPFSIYLYAATTPHHAAQQINAVHIDVDILQYHYPKVLARICTLSGKCKRLYARQTVVARVDKNISSQFLAEHHLQEVMPGKYRYGLYDNGELVSLAVFSGGRRNHEKPAPHRSFELIRFCHKSNYLVVGGLSKLLKAFYSDFKPGDIMSYCDLDWSQNSSLSQIGFELKGQIPSIKLLIQEGRRYTIHAEEQEIELRKQYPKSYIKYNLGSLKMVKYYE